MKDDRYSNKLVKIFNYLLYEVLVLSVDWVLMKSYKLMDFFFEFFLFLRGGIVFCDLYYIGSGILVVFIFGLDNLYNLVFVGGYVWYEDYCVFFSLLISFF